MPPKKKEKQKKQDKTFIEDLTGYTPQVDPKIHEQRKVKTYTYLNHWTEIKKPRNSADSSYKVKPRTYFLQDAFTRFNVEIVEESANSYRLKSNDKNPLADEFTINISGSGIDSVVGHPFRTKNALDAFVTAVFLGLHWYHSQMDNRK